MAKGDKPPRKRGRKVRVDFRRNRGKVARDKTASTGRYQSDENAESAPSVENVRAKGDLSRKRTIVIRETDEAGGALLEGQVVAARGLVADVDDGNRTWACTVRRVLRTRLIDERNPVVVGDRVRFRSVEGEAATFAASRETQSPGATHEDSRLPAVGPHEAATGEGVIEDVLPRTTTLRRQYENRVQIVAANVDNVVIVSAADQPTLRPHLIDRYIVAVHQGDMRPIVCINKADLDVDEFAANVADCYAEIGYKSLLTCVSDSRGIDELRELLKDQTTVFVGQSGVGKSSLINALDSRLRLRIGEVSELERGRHTTTTAQLVKWAFGGFVVDTPGLRQFDLADIPSQELDGYFIEFRDLVPLCRFPNCSHKHEEECAVRSAVDAGAIDESRYDSFCKMYEECLAKEKR